MNLKAKFEIGLRRFVKKYGRIIIIAVVFISAIIFIDRALKAINEKNDKPKTSYTPNVSVLDSNETVPTKIQKSTEDFVSEFVKCCNENEYEEAYSMLSADCRTDFFGSLLDFKAYINKRFPSEKKYAIQSYSVFNNKYIYNIKIFDDFLATGLTNSTFRFTEEKIVASYDEDKKLVFSIGSFIEKNTIQSVQENEYLKVDVKNQVILYDYEQYNIKLTNRSNNRIIIQNQEATDDEIKIDLGNEYRTNENINDVILEPGEAKSITAVFPKFYDDGDKTRSIIFSSVRVMNSKNKEIDKFSMTMGF